MKIRKTLVAGLALSMVATLGLSGCGSSSDVEKTADGKVKITMWHGFSEADGKTLESIVKDFNKSQDKYEIDAQLQPWSTIGETMVTKVTSGDGPDFVTTGADNGINDVNNVVLFKFRHYRCGQRARLVHRWHLPVRHRFL